MYTGLNFYPGAVTDIVSRLNKSGADARKPAFYFSQQYGYYDSSREPTPREQKWTAYASFIIGTRMMYQFVYRPMSISLWDETKTFTGELQKIFERTVEPGARQVAQKTVGDILYALWKTDDGYLLVIANSSDNAVTGKIQLADLPERIKVSSCTPLTGIGKLAVDNDAINISLDGLNCGSFILK
jgi:hypothetical protein